MAPRADYETIITARADLSEKHSGVIIKTISPESPLKIAGIKSGDSILTVNGHPVHDLIDFHFYTGGETELDFITSNPQGKRSSIHITKTEDQSLDVELENFSYRHCGNKCIFCFVDQNPPGVRKALLFKDEDYRLSFLWGNFTTLTNTSKKDLARIVEQRLSPLYVSIHATELELRKKMLGIKKDDHLFDKLKYLSTHQIEMHGQIVLCPGLNDGKQLEKTCLDLLKHYPALNTLAVVPLGLTRHRQGLPELTPVTKEYAVQFIQEVERLQTKILKKGISDYLYLADEWYLRARKPLPSFRSYGRFPHIENGVGIVRRFLKEFSTFKKHLPKRLKKKKKIHLMTSVSAAGFMKKVVADCQKQTANLEISLHPVKNYFYGEMITVSGLLTGIDFYRELQDKEIGDLVLLPPNCIKEDEDIFLDDMTVKDLSRKLKCPVVVCRDGAEQLVSEICNLAG